MDYTKLVENVTAKANALKEGIGHNRDELKEMGFSDGDIKKIMTTKKEGYAKFEDGTFKATELCAKIALDEFFAMTDDEAEFIIEEELNSRDATDFRDSFHFIKNFDEDEWTCLYTKTTYGLTGTPNDFVLKEIKPEEDNTDDLENLLRYVQSYDKRFTENKAYHILNQYHFQNGELGVFG